MKDDLSISFIPDACATCWGSACPGGNTTYYSTCPQTQVAIAGPIYSADVHVTISNSGTGVVPNGTLININIAPAGGASSYCPDVTCLKREITNYQATWNGNGSVDLTFDTLGCSTQGCTNSYVVTATFADPNLGSTLQLNCPATQPSITLVNASTVQAPIDLKCTSTQTYTCAGAPGGPPVSSTEQCQQAGTATGCTTGWTPNGKTCPPGATTNACCTQNACTVTQPTVQLVCQL